MESEAKIQPWTLDPEQAARVTKAMDDRAVDPRAFYAKLRAKGPVDLEHHGMPAVMTRDDVMGVLRDTAVWSTDYPLPGWGDPVIPLNIDPPLHSTYRRLLDPLFSPRRMATLEPAVTEHVNTIIDTFIGEGRVNFSTDLAIPLPCLTFLGLLGLPADEVDTLVFWKDVLARPDHVVDDVADIPELQARTVEKINRRYADEVADRRRNPRDDLITFLTTAEVEGRKLTEYEINRTLFLLLPAGLDTVTISLEHIFHYLAEHPEAQKLLADEPETTTSAVEELLRWETPVLTPAPRLAKVDTEVAGIPVKAGTMVAAQLSPLNVDPDNPVSLEVDLRRGDKSHLAFGGGPHRCLGSHLARMELRAVVREWHKRIPRYSIEPGTNLQFVAGPNRGIDNLQLVWDPTTTKDRIG